MRYCNQCGRPIREGEVCSCQGGSRQTTVSPRPTPVSPMGNDSKSRGTIPRPVPTPIPPGPVPRPISGESFWQRILSLFTKPVEEIRDMVLTGDSMMGIKLLLVNVALTVVAVAIMTSVLQNSANGLFGNILGRVGIATGIVYIIGNLIISLIITTLLLLFSKAVFHAQTTFADIFIIVESKAVLDGAFLLFYAVLYSLSVKLAILVFILGQVYSFLVMILGYAETVELEGSKKVFSLLLTFVCFIVMCYALYSMTINSIKNSMENSVDFWQQDFNDYLESYQDDYE